MTDFNELQAAYAEDPARALQLIDGLEPQARLDMLLENLGAGRRSMRLEETKYSNLPAAYRKIPHRWESYDNLLSFDIKPLTFHMQGHVEFEAEGGTYIRNTLALLLWKAHVEPVEDEQYRDSDLALA
jgi:hypothetical protein